VNRGFINYPFLKEYDPLLENLRGDERFNKLMSRVKKELENFELQALLIFVSLLIDEVCEIQGQDNRKIRSFP
jgi:hypothetical protein